MSNSWRKNVDKTLYVNAYMKDMIQLTEKEKTQNIKISDVEKKIVT